jgi:hypothetical protein
MLLLGTAGNCCAFSTCAAYAAATETPKYVASSILLNAAGHLHQPLYTHLQLGKLVERHHLLKIHMHPALQLLLQPPRVIVIQTSLASFKAHQLTHARQAKTASLPILLQPYSDSISSCRKP